MSTTIKELLEQIARELEQLNRREEGWIQDMRLWRQEDEANSTKREEEARQRWQEQVARDERFVTMHQQERQEDLARIAKEREEYWLLREQEGESAQTFGSILSQKARQQQQDEEERDA